MDKGIDLAGAREHARVLDDLKDQLLIVLLKRLVDKNGELSVPVAEIDDIGKNTLAFTVDPDTRMLHFVIGKKQ